MSDKIVFAILKGGDFQHHLDIARHQPTSLVSTDLMWSTGPGPDPSSLVIFSAHGSIAAAFARGVQAEAEYGRDQGWFGSVSVSGTANKINPDEFFPNLPLRLIDVKTGLAATPD